MAFVSQPPMPQTLQMKVKGLYTNPNQLSEAPDGALSIADNIWISRDSVGEPRRGFVFLPYTLPHNADRADKLGQFQNSLIIHYNNTGTTNANDSLAYYNNSTGIQTYTGVFAHPDPLLARMKFAESNKNLYFTTAAGVYKLDAVTNQPVVAGMYQALDVTASASSSMSGFQNNNSEVAYRVVWGITDANQNLILGAPSSRAIISNTSGGVQNVSLQITIPAGITVDHFYQIYRSDQSISIVAQATGVIQDITYTANPSGYSGSAGNGITVSYTTGGTAGSEVVSVSGMAISIQIQSGVSIAAQVLAAFNNHASALVLASGSITGLAANVQTAAATVTLANGSTTLSVPDDNMQLVYEANPTSMQISAKSITVIDSTPDSLRGAALYTNSTQQGILQAYNMPPYAQDLALFQTCMFYANTQTLQQLFLTVIAVGGSGGIQSGDTLTIDGTTYTAGASENVGTLTYHLVTSGSPAQNINDTTLSLIRVINQNSTNTGVYAYYLSGANALPGQMLIQARVLGTAAFTITGSGTLTAFSPVVPSSGSTLISTNTANLNGLMYSVPGQPEAVPALNILYVGSASKPIRRIIAIRNSLFILKDDGVFRCTGVAGNFAIDTIDLTIILLAPESVVSLSNQAFCLTTQGVVAISDNGGPIISRPIEDQLTELEGQSLSVFQELSFGVSYESERQYVLWTITESTDTYCTQAFIYNYITKTWTRSTRQQVHGMVLTADNKMYLLNPNSNAISQERKSYNYTDYSDEAYPVNITSFNGYVLNLSSTQNISPGDAIYQSGAAVSLVLAVNTVNNTVLVLTALTSWTVGAASILKAIPCLMEWLPNAAGNPGYYRHWREAVLMFRSQIFNNAYMNFYSEISTGVDQVPIAGQLSGGWGEFGWGEAPWGGIFRSKPFRTYVPRDKQRCDLLSIQFQCSNVWSQFQIEGLSCILQTIGERMTN